MKYKYTVYMNRGYENGYEMVYIVSIQFSVFLQPFFLIW